MSPTDTMLETVPLELWSALDQLLSGVGHSWTFDASTREVWCKDCDWALDDVDFLPAAEAARSHRDDVKRAVVDKYRESLGRET